MPAILALGVSTVTAVHVVMMAVMMSVGEDLFVLIPRHRFADIVGGRIATG